MKDYLLALVFASFSLTVLELLAPEKSKHERLVFSLCMLCITATPLLSLARGDLRTTLDDWLSNLPSQTESQSGDGIFQGALNVQAKNILEEDLQTLLCREFAIAATDCRVKTTIEGESLSSVTVILSGSGIWKDTAAIEARVEALVGCPCYTALNLGG